MPAVFHTESELLTSWSTADFQIGSRWEYSVPARPASHRGGRGATTQHLLAWGLTGGDE